MRQLLIWHKIVLTDLKFNPLMVRGVHTGSMACQSTVAVSTTTEDRKQARWPKVPWVVPACGTPPQRGLSWCTRLQGELGGGVDWSGTSGGRAGTSGQRWQAGNHTGVLEGKWEDRKAEPEAHTEGERLETKVGVTLGRREKEGTILISQLLADLIFTIAT